MTALALTRPADAAYSAADEALARRGHTFHRARRLLSARHAERATRLYGFCRRIDDLADEGRPPAAARAELAKARAALQGGQSDDPALRDMLQLMAGCGIDAEIPLELIRGVEGDLGEVRMADTAELLTYCYRVGALEPAALVDPIGAERAAAVLSVHALLALADRHYASGEQGLHHLPATARAGILVAARVYQEIGVVLRQHDGDCWSSRAAVGSAAKAAVTLRALGGTAGPQRRAAAGATGATGATGPIGWTYGLALRVPPARAGAVHPTQAGHGD